MDCGFGGGWGWGWGMEMEVVGYGNGLDDLVWWVLASNELNGV